MPVRGLVGYRNDFLTQTKGLGILTSTFHEYQPWRGDIPGRYQGVLISMSPGKANAYASFTLAFMSSTTTLALSAAPLPPTQPPGITASPTLYRFSIGVFWVRQSPGQVT